MRVVRLAALVCISLAACVEVPGVPAVTPPGEDGGPVTGRDGGSTGDGGAVADAENPTIAITTPAPGATFPNATATVAVEGTADDDVGIAAVQVSLGPNAAVAAATDDFYRTWRVALPLPPGTFPIRARAFDVSGKTAEAAVSVTRTPRSPDQSPPVLVLLEPADGTRTTRQGVVVRGTASDDTGLSVVEARVDGLTSYAPVETTDTFATWRAQAGLAPGVENLIRVRATDLAGKTAEKTVRVVSLTAADQIPPTLVVESPRDGGSVATETVAVTGTAADNLGVARVEVRVGSGAYLSATSSDNFATWSATVPLAPGANALRVRATDVSDLETVVTLTVQSTFAPAWSPAREYELRLAAPRDRSVSLILDKQGLTEVIPESVRRSIVLLNLDPTPLMTTTMETIKNSCGAGWENGGFTPSCPPAWGTAEVNLWRLLTMTPDNVNVQGTSIEELRDIADALASLGLIDEFSDILSAALGIGRTAAIVDTANAVAALRDDVIKTHPNANADGTLPVTIEDGVTDMRELSTRFGPAGSHPGFLDPATPTFSKVLLDSFTMSVQGTSNLTWHDGVDLSLGKEYIALLPSPSTDVISFDFAGTLSVTGLAPSPAVDMAFVMREHPQFLAAATRQNDQNPPAHPGAGAAWSVPRYYIEYVLVDAAFRKYRTRTVYLLYEDPIFGIDEAAIAVGRNDNDHFPVITNLAGWARFWTLLGIGSPPDAQYLWEMIAEISQIRLRDGGVAEGQGSTRFVLTGIPVGLTGPQIIAQMRPQLEAQKSLLAKRLLGDFQLNNGAVDFYLKGVPGDLYLFFVHSTDPLPRTPYDYAKPGFFADAALTQKVSTTASQTSGDAVHEKIKLDATARTAYAQDNQGAVYRIEIQPAQSDRVALRVSKKL